MSDAITGKLLIEHKNNAVKWLTYNVWYIYQWTTGKTKNQLSE